MEERPQEDGQADKRGGKKQLWENHLLNLTTSISPSFFCGCSSSEQPSALNIAQCSTGRFRHSTAKPAASAVKDSAALADLQHRVVPGRYIVYLGLKPVSFGPST